jgi:pilus assembly protein CpaC
MKHALLKNSFIITLGFVLVLLYIPQLSADDNTSESEQTIDMIAGDIQSVPAHNLTRVSVTNPDVADISDAQSDKITLLAKKAGETALFLWDASGRRSVTVRVVNEDLDAVKARVQKVLDEAGITGVSFEENRDIGKLVLSGSLTKDDKNRLDDVVGPYSDNLLNLVKEEKSEELIQVDMQIVEISTTLEESLGIQWGNEGAGSGSNSGTSGNTSISSGLVSEAENVPPTNGTIKNAFKWGSFQRSGFEVTINALLQEGKARLISKPRLVAVSGKQASFLVGGEIPVENTTSSPTSGTVGTSTTYSQYGVNLSVTPTIRKGKIDVVLNVDIRDVDNSSSFVGSLGGNIAFITRTASTELLMDNKQTVALAGLIKHQNAVTYTKIPFLSKIPFIGALFTSKNIPGDADTEMVIVLTPTVLTNKKFADKEVVMPTPEERKAWNEVIESKYPHEPLPSWPVAKIAPDNNLQTVLPEMTAYARMVQEKISNAIRYPQISGKPLAGTVKLKLRILRDGSLNSEEVVESSGNDILDQDAVQAAKTAAPFDAFTMGMAQEDLIFTVPIVYNKIISQKAAPSEKVIAAY